MVAPIVFMDTETTGLGPEDQIWEIAAIRLDPDGTHTEFHAFVIHDYALAANLPDSFRADHGARYFANQAITAREMCLELRVLFNAPEDYSQRAHVAGAVPSFDTERIAKLMRRYGLDVPWHHHLIDVEVLAAGMMRTSPPWDSDDLSRLIGVDPDQFERHTALGDVRWAMAFYDAVLGNPF